MDTNVTESTKVLPPAEVKKPGKTKQSTNRFSIFISVITLIILCLAAFYFWQQQAKQSLQVEHLLSIYKKDDKKIDGLQQTTQQQINSLNDLGNKQQILLNSLAKESYLNSQKLSDLGARSRTDWLLAEAEYLMHLANQRLTLEQDISSAEAMLSSADKVIEEINDPGLFEIRQALASEIVSLQQVSHLDYQGLYLRLDALAESIDSIKQRTFIKETSHVPAETNQVSQQETSALLKAWSSIWNDLKQAVSIRRLDQPVEPLLAPEQNYYLKQNLRLMLEQASLALLDKNTVIFQSSLNKASTWIRQYFEQDDQQIQALQNALSDMAKYNIDQTLPDISKSLRLTKSKIEGFYKNHSLSKLSTPDSEIKAENNDQGSAL